MTRYLKPDVHAVVVGADLAVLDIAGDAYLCLPGGAAALVGDSGAAITAGPLAEALAEGGLLAAGPAPTRRTPPAWPTRSIIHDPHRERPDARALLAAAGVVADLRRARAGQGVAAYLALAEADRELSRDPEAVLAAARLFWTIGPWLPIEGECLPRSAMLVAFLRRLGLAADWVFGVRLWPFNAHCWVQAGDVCLNDDVERLWAYTPIYCR
jgi:transglutaminase-like putative cysteine protease